MILYLVRHGEAQLNVLGILHSRNYNDNPLTDKGRLEAAAVALLLHRMGVHGPVFTSPLLRARQTADCIDRNYKVDERLREIDMGEWELKKISEIPFDNYRKDPVRYHPPGGESMESVVNRVMDFLNFVRGINEKSVIAVSHWHPIATVVALVTGLPLSNIYKLRISTGSITAIDLDNDDVLFLNLSPLRVLRSLGLSDDGIMKECIR
ncbi:histidine phosphatase family protein [Vulcanisaeta distributa]|uniref:Phosphoglycerate mutase n=1 Tax=Vulcanisaeta distributa (strain DSM 14429 / JCM 11212 / NBRC 100878 / IC-017) TaxID=572478 RepID=E1QTK9_VULDI|nr:histidine phosphatase family protein [Vulcanisaeta distributa]ADN49724.1 Phosphoglycerate mutase [Vulcanisaeta distributa DSM 14429]